LLHVVACYYKVQYKRPEEHFIYDFSLADSEHEVDVAAAVGEEGPFVVPTVFFVVDASNFRAQGFGVNDDNKPTPENIPQAKDNI
jgi:hypothetical protein